MKSAEYAKKEREFALLEKLDDEIVSHLARLDHNGINIKELVEEYLQLDTFDIPAYKAFLKKVKS